MFLKKTVKNSLSRVISLFSPTVVIGLDHKKDRGITSFLKIKISHIKCFSRGTMFWLNSLRIDNEKQSTWYFWFKQLRILVVCRLGFFRISAQ